MVLLLAGTVNLSLTLVLDNEVLFVSEKYFCLEACQLSKTKVKGVTSLFGTIFSLKES